MAEVKSVSVWIDDSICSLNRLNKTQPLILILYKYQSGMQMYLNTRPLSLMNFFTSIFPVRAIQVWKFVSKFVCLRLLA